jgi:PAS domain S-box-containing protein
VSYLAYSPEPDTLLEPLEHQFRALVECSADAIFITDFDSAQFVHVNARACAMFGYEPEELRGMTGRQLHAPEDQALVDEISRDLIQNGSVMRGAVRLQRRDGQPFWAELRSSAYCARERRLYVTFIRDISGKLDREKQLNEAYEALRSMEAQLIRSSRLAAIGQIAAGVAHEVNNPAAGALMNLQVLDRDLTTLSEVVEQTRDSFGSASSLGELRRLTQDALSAARDSSEAVQRIASVVRGLSRFARIDEEEVRNTSLSDAASSAVRLVQHQLRHIATIRCELASARQFPADQGKLTQVFVNLLSNAGHAIEHGGGSCITVRTLDSADGVFASVEDDGPGVPAEIASAIFEPFFTTKGPDQGTGLGLPLCADIVHQHKGRLELRSRQVRGACFEIFLPLQTGLSVRAPRVSEPPVAGGRILVVDDDTALVRAYRRWLGRKHEIVVAHDAEDALLVLEQDDAFDAVLCDLMMPRCDGVALHERLTERKPELLERVIFCSGGPTTRRCRDFIERPGIVFFEKPIRQDLLDQCISRLISKRANVTPRP